MRRTLALITVAGIVAGALAGPALAGTRKPAHQHVEGSIAFPQPYAADGTCIYRVQRTLFAFGGPNGIFGHTFKVDPKTAGGKFQLKASAGAGLDISFYSDLGDPSDPTTAPSNMGFETPGPGGEKGTVPKGFKFAFVCMTEGANAEFTYMATKR